MSFDPFDIIGTWKLTSETSSELLKFNTDGTYCIYYEVPFRLIELGEWKIYNSNILMLFYSNTDIICKITQLTGNDMEFTHLSEYHKLIKDNYKRIN